MTTQRTDPPMHADERTMLASFLEYHRQTMEWKCSGLSHAQLRERVLPPSNLSLLGLVRHMAEVERGWFRRTLAGEDAPRIYHSDEDPDGDFDNVADADVDEAFATWRAECAITCCRQFIPTCSSTSWLLANCRRCSSGMLGSC